MGDKLTSKQRSKRPAHGLGALPGWMIEPIKRAEQLFRAARFEDLAGNHETAERLRTQAEQIYNNLEARQAGQPGALPQDQAQRIDTKAR